MVHGNTLAGYYGIFVSKPEYERLSEELPMKYANLFKCVGEQGYLIKIDLKRRVKERTVADDYSALFKTSVQKPARNFADGDSGVFRTIQPPPEDKIDEDDAIAIIEKKITSYRGNFYDYMGLTKVTLSDVEKHYYVDLAKLRTELEAMVAPFKEHLWTGDEYRPCYEHSFCFYVYAYSY